MGAWARTVAGLALLGATVGSALDAIHTHTGTTSYPEPWIFRMAFWTPPLFAGAAVAMGTGRPLWARFFGEPSGAAPADRRAVAGSLAVFITAYALSGLVPGPWFVRAALLAALAVFSWWRWDRTVRGVVLAVTAGVCGCFVEITLVGAGAFSYVTPDVLGVPAWLPLLYAAGSVALGCVGARLASSS
jgi:hypothetical protein